MRRPSFNSLVYFVATVLWLVTALVFKRVLYYGLAAMCLALAIYKYDKK